MTSGEDVDADDDFSDIYKAYTGPLSSKGPPVVQENTMTSKRSHSGSDEEEIDDPNAVPTDFTSREAKVWEAKSKATERNWKKRKEEEMRCKICWETGHFTQGCPTTLGANHKSQDFIERVPAREVHVKSLFSEEVISKIELDIGCKIKIDEKFIIVSGKDRLILKKGVNAVHKVKEEGEKEDVRKSKEEDEIKDVHHNLPEVREHKGSASSRSKSPERKSPLTSRFGRSDSLSNTAHIPDRCGRAEKVVEEHVREDLHKMSGGSPQAYGSDGGRGRSSHSKSPALPSYVSSSSYERHSQSRGTYADRGVSDMHSLDRPSIPRSLEEIEFQYRRQAMELARFRDKEEDEENYKHRENVRDIGEKYIKKVGMLKFTHDRMWEDFLQLEDERRQQQARRCISSYGNGGYKHTDFGTSSGSIQHSGADMPMDTRARYRNDVDNYPSSRFHDNYGEFQRHRRDEFGKPYNQF